MQKRKQIKAAILVDPAGHMGQTADEEAAEHIQTFKKVVAPAVLKAYRCHSADAIQTGTNLVVYDYGGLMPGSDMMERNARYLVQWAEDHSNALIVVVSGFTYKNFIEVEMEEHGMKLPNIVVDDGKVDLCYMLPDWWKDRFGVETNDEDSREATTPAKIAKLEEEFADLQRKDQLIEKEQQEAAAEERRKQDEGFAEVRKKLAVPIGYITVPVFCDWRPGQKTGFLRWKVADCVVDVTDDATDKIIAKMGGAFAGAYECNFTGDTDNERYSYSLRPETLFEAFKKMHQEFLEKEKEKCA